MKHFLLYQTIMSNFLCQIVNFTSNNCCILSRRGGGGGGGGVDFQNNFENFVDLFFRRPN